MGLGESCTDSKQKAVRSKASRLRPVPSVLPEELGREAQTEGTRGHPETLEGRASVRGFPWSRRLSEAQWAEAEVKPFACCLRPRGGGRAGPGDSASPRRRGGLDGVS